MATQTPLVHPDLAQQMAVFYPHSVTFKTTGDDGVQEPVLTSPCTYAGESEDFENEAATADQLLLPQWEPTVRPDQLAVVTLSDGTTKRLTVLDSLPQGAGPSKTLVMVVPN